MILGLALPSVSTPRHGAVVLIEPAKAGPHDLPGAKLTERNQGCSERLRGHERQIRRAGATPRQRQHPALRY